MLSSDSLPDELRFRFGDAQLHFVIADRPGDLESAAAWRADSGETGTARQTVFRTLWDAIVVLEPTEQDAAVEYLLTWAGQPLVSPTSRLPVSGDQFAELADHDLIELGSHTLDHVSLTDLPPEGQRVQIYAGHRMIEELSGRPVTQFAFPSAVSTTAPTWPFVTSASMWRVPACPWPPSSVMTEGLCRGCRPPRWTATSSPVG